MRDFGKSRTVYSVRWPCIEEVLRSFNPSDYYVGLSKRKEIGHRVEEIAGSLVKWIDPIVDLKPLPHAYPTSGTHHAIEQWLASETRRICCLLGEYPYPRHLRRDVVVVASIDEIPSDAVVYMSNPFSATGKYDDRYLEIENPMVLDLAYVGTTAPRCLELKPNVEQVFWSASKAFGLGNFRTGFRFSKRADPLQDQIKDTGYYNLLGLEVLMASIGTMCVTDAWDMIGDRYIKLCEECRLQPSDTYLIATSTDDAFRHLMREDGTIRISTGRILEDMNGMG